MVLELRTEDEVVVFRLLVFLLRVFFGVSVVKYKLSVVRKLHPRVVYILGGKREIS